MSQPQDEIQRRRFSKVKTGCITCKIRRVKCDEVKPNCMKCTSTGRKCDGYQPQGPKTFRFRITSSSIVAENGNSAYDLAGALMYPPGTMMPIFATSHLQIPPSPYNPLLNFQGSSKEHRALEFFRQRAAPDLSGYFDSKFWNDMIPCIGASEPAVQHAMSALGAMYEFLCDEKAYPDSKQQAFALLQYNKAIGLLKEVTGYGSKNIEVTLLTCILFICLEFMRGDPECAMNHVHSGMKILTSIRKPHHIADFMPKRMASGVKVSAIQSLEEGLVHTFSRLSVQASLYGRPLQSVHKGIETTEDRQSASRPFHSIQEARLSLDQIFFQSTRPQDFILNDCEGKFDSEFHPLDADKTERDNLIEQLNYWNSRLDLYIADSVPSPSGRDIRGLQVLQILSIIGRIWNATTLTHNECSFDSYLEDFRTIVRLATSFISDEDTSKEALSTGSSASTSQVYLSTPFSKSPTRSRHFTFEMGIMPTLYMTATKCRNPSVRRKAIELLLIITPRREGFWDALVLASIAQRVIELEEGPDTTELNWPPEHRRIHCAYIRIGYGFDKRITEVEFAARPNGPGSEWKFWREKVLLSPES